MYNTSLSKWNTKRLFNRDLVKELSEACNKRGLGLFLYVTPPNDYLKDELKVMLRELLTNYGAIAGIWFDGIGECYRHPNDFWSRENCMLMFASYSLNVWYLLRQDSQVTRIFWHPNGAR